VLWSSARNVTERSGKGGCEYGRVSLSLRTLREIVDWRDC
jgi:hypothetical protein